MRLFIIIGLFVVAITCPALAGCTPHPIGMSEQSFADALLHRMRPMGINDISRVSTVEDRDHYAALGSDLSVFLTPEGGGLKEIGLVLSEPASPAETEKLITASAFTLAKMLESPEKAIRSQLSKDLSLNASGSWNETFGSAVAVFTRSSDGTVVKLGLLTCS